MDITGKWYIGQAAYIGGPKLVFFIRLILVLLPKFCLSIHCSDEIIGLPLLCSQSLT